MQWRHIDLAGGRLRVEDAKTAAGIRRVTLQPVLRDELLALRADASTTSPSAPVFATARGHAMSVDNVRSRVFGAAVNRANERRQEAGQPPLPANLTPHSLRRTYISALLALGWEVPVVMAEVGHSDPKVTLGIYAQVMRRDDASRDRLRALLEGHDFGSNRQREGAPNLDAAIAADPRNDETPADAGIPSNGRGGFRTCDLSRVKRGRGALDLADLQGKSRESRGVRDRMRPEPAGFCREFGTTLSQTDGRSAPSREAGSWVGWGMDSTGCRRTRGVLTTAHATSM